MRVLQLAKYYPPTYGGIELVEKMMTMAHRDHGDDVFINAFSSEEKNEIGEFGEKILRIREHFNLLNAPINFDYIKSFRQYITQNKIERIYVHLPNPFMHQLIILNRFFLKKRKIQLIAVYHSDIVNKGWLGELYNRFFLFTSQCYQQIIVSSQELWNSSPVLSKLDKDKKRVIPFCIEESGIDPIQKTQPKKFVTIGRLVPYKGFDVLISAMNKTDFELHIVGDGPMRQILQSMAKPNVHFHFSMGHREKNRLLAESDVLLVGSINRAEAYGMTIVEAFSVGVPVIAPVLHTGVNFLVQNNVTGLTYSVKNSDELLDQIQRISTDQNLYQKLSENCMSFYRNNLTYSNFKTGLMSL